jgi:hypothetical protein
MPSESQLNDSVERASSQVTAIRIGPATQKNDTACTKVPPGPMAENPHLRKNRKLAGMQIIQENNGTTNFTLNY